MNMTPEESARQPFRPHPLPPNVDPLAREAQFLADLAQLASDRAAAETQIAAQLRARTAASERAVQEARRSLAAQLESDRADMGSDYAEQRQHAHARHQLDTSTIERQFAEMQHQVAADYDRSTKRAKRKLKESRWESETLFDASKDVAPRKLKEFEENLQTWLARGHNELDAARALLALWQIALTPVAVPAEPANLELSSALAQLKERVEFLSAERLRLAELRLPAVAARLHVVWLVVLAGLLAGLAAAGGGGPLEISAAFVLALGMGLGISFYLRRQSQAQVEEIYPALSAAGHEVQRLAECALSAARAQAAAQQAELIERRQRSMADAEEKYQARTERAARQRDERLEAPALSYPERLNEITARRDRDLELAEGQRARRYEEILRKEADGASIEERYLLRTEQIQRQHGAQWQTLIDQWKAGLARLHALAEAIQGSRDGEPASPWLDDWSKMAAGSWRPATAVPPAVRFGQFRIDLAQIPEGMPGDPRLAELAPQEFSLPALLPFPSQVSMLFKARGGGRNVAVDAMQSVMLRLLVSVPPGKLRLTIIDPVGLGENFAAFMHLADFNEALVSSRIWTEPKHIEQRLADLSEHMENVIQKYLRNEYPSIEAYNREAGEIAEPYRFLVVANYPANFSEAAQRRLLSIASSGARCGVYTLIMVDSQLPLPSGVSLADLERHGATLVWQHERFVWRDERWGPFELTLDVPPAPAVMTSILQDAGRYANEAGRVEVPFEVIAPAETDLWTSSARAGIDVPLGRAGATRLQFMKLGQGTSQHVLIAGKTGSGKSTLLHALVTNLALRYSPEEVELYLVDFKQGVEFKTYATHELPHARVVAVESDREFGVSVLGRLDAELKRRAEAFRAAGVQDLAGYRTADPATPMPRLLLVVDEFQEFFVEDDKISQDAALLLDRLVRQGRAFGIHVLLGSQTLAGTYSLARSTIGQMAVRIALQCSETDAHLILSEENSAARLLSRAGEAIYNDSNGLVEGNHPFQIVWLSDQRRESYLEQIHELAKRNGHAERAQIVFEGNVPADLDRNQALVELITGPRPSQPTPAPGAYLGEAVAIKDPTCVVFRRQSGSNLLMVGQNESAALGAFGSLLVSLAAGCQPREAGPGLYILDGSPAGSEQSRALGHLAGLLSPAARLVGAREVATTIQELSIELQRRQAADEAESPAIFVLVYGLQRLRDLRRGEEDFGFSRSGEERPPDPGKQFSAIVREGPAAGMHVVVWCDSVNNLNRAWDRQTLREFEMRVAFQMSGNDSSTFIDTPTAARLGPHRALFHSEEQGTLEKFRPYRWPSEEWMAWVAGQLAAGPSMNAPGN
ncbi:MAG TPA: FtsK/SpoIIIE domain-containing protein [Pirellulales bacterium]|jgi:energy-coupling factor transporter ATP-binding protein EcfA2|nr:FtsK/SpoIIIE domain-containing protein [Pirellulales bacterium]